jgi:hypothetical protein
MRGIILPNKSALVLTIINVFKTFKREFALNKPSLSRDAVNKRDARIVYLNFSYRFGAQSKKSKEEQIHYDDKP